MTAGPVAAVGVILVDDRGRILLQLRDSHPLYPHHWATVGGVVEAGESLEQAARREVLEETGYRLTSALFVGSSGELTLPHGERRHVTVFVAPYDRAQSVDCHEGLEIAFVNPSTLETLTIYPGQKELILQALARYSNPASARP
jgi:8-oxo-dGTP pyrophosphatase MutT (NUDIX family)